MKHFKIYKFLIITLVLMTSTVYSVEKYLHSDTEGIEWYPTGKNLTYTKSGPRVNSLFTEHSRNIDQGIFKIGDNVYQAYGEIKQANEWIKTK